MSLLWPILNLVEELRKENVCLERNFFFNHSQILLTFYVKHCVHIAEIFSVYFFPRSRFSAFLMVFRNMKKSRSRENLIWSDYLKVFECVLGFSFLPSSFIGFLIEFETWKVLWEIEKTFVQNFLSFACVIGILLHNHKRNSIMYFFLVTVLYGL